MGAGNPCRDLISEAYDVFGGDAYVSTILSLGTGHLGSISVPENNSEDEWIEVLQDMVKNNEKTAQEMESQLGHLGLYYRFAVDQGLQKVYGMSANDATRVHSQSQAYLQQVEISRRIDHCVEDLRLRQGHATLEQLSMHKNHVTQVISSKSSQSIPVVGSLSTRACLHSHLSSS